VSSGSAPGIVSVRLCNQVNVFLVGCVAGYWENGILLKLEPFFYRRRSRRQHGRFIKGPGVHYSLGRHKLRVNWPAGNWLNCLSNATCDVVFKTPPRATAEETREERCRFDLCAREWCMTEKGRNTVNGESESIVR